jgi:uncharacterized protein (TIGR04255 family)
MKIDLTEQFEHLAKAPIVEAAIEIRARAEGHWDETAISQQIKTCLSDYPKVTSLKQIQQEIKFQPGKPVEGLTRDLGWQGLQFQSEDGRRAVQFSRDAFVFNQLPPYEGWETLLSEAMRLWQIHAGLARPSEAQRLGLRFINRIALPANDPNFEDYIRPHAVPPHNLDLPFVGFFHQDSLAVPGYPYLINIVRMIEPARDHLGVAIVLDIDVFTAQPFELRDDKLQLYLAEMRHLKNKIFFGSITEKALQGFK